ncbi:MAG: hypothetical protein Q8P67_05865 [archaeon]|nr:hypothetical protein [archaeon]
MVSLQILKKKEIEPSSHLLDMLTTSSSMIGLVSCVSSLAGGLVGWNGRETLLLTNAFIASHLWMAHSVPTAHFHTSVRLYLTLSTLGCASYLGFQSFQERNDHPMEVEAQFDDLDFAAYRRNMV